MEQKDPVKPQKRKVAPERIFGNTRNYFEFAIDWERTTGEILMRYERTRERGKMKLEDAKLRETEMNMLIERRII